jgi:hypothetical protein
VAEVELSAVNESGLAGLQLAVQDQSAAGGDEQSGNGAGDEDRTRNFQLGNQKFRSFIFTTYKTTQQKSTCMHCIPCMQCLICVSLGDVWGTVCHQNGPYVLMQIQASVPIINVTRLYHPVMTSTR